MGLVRWWRSRIRLGRLQRARDARVDKAVQAVVDAVDPRMRGLSGYRRKLAPAIEKAARYAGELADALPPPVEVARERWAGDPVLRACFASVDVMQEFFDNDRRLRKFLAGADARGADRVFATLGMRVQRSTRHGYSLQGETVQRGVEQVGVGFVDLRIGEITTDEAALRDGLQRRILGELATRALQRIMGMQTRKAALSEEQAVLRWKLKVYEMREQGVDTLWRDKSVYQRHARDLRERLDVTHANLDDLLHRAGNIEHFLDTTVEEFEKAPDMISLEPTSLWLNNMNIEVDASAPRAREVSLMQVRIGKRRPRVVLPVAFDPAFPQVDTGAALRKAARALGV